MPDPSRSEDDWGFTDPADAHRYLGELRRLWVLWLAGLALLMSAPGPSMVFVGLGIAGLLVLLSRPLQRRATRIVPFNTVRGSRWSPLLGRATARDKALHAFLYGVEPLTVAVEMTGRSPWWLLARRLVMVATLAGFVLVLLGFVTGWDQPTALGVLAPDGWGSGWGSGWRTGWPTPWSR